MKELEPGFDPSKYKDTKENQALLFVDPRKPDEFIVVGPGTPIQEVKIPGL